MWRRFQVTVCPEGWYYLIILSFVIGGALLRDINLLIAVAAMMAGLFVLNWWITKPTLRGIRVQRRMPDGVCVGDLLVVELHVTNSRKLGSWAVSIEDRIRRLPPRGRSPIIGRALVPYVSARKPLRVAYRGRLLQRGRYQFGPMSVSTRFPFGLVQRRLRLKMPAKLTVFPRLGQLTPYWHQNLRTDREGHQRSISRQGATEGEFHGLRDWRSGDSRNWIHWRTSAKRDQLSVRMFERQSNQGLTIVLNLGHPDARNPDTQNDLEQAVSFVATVIAHQCRQGNSRLNVACAGQEKRVTSGTASMVMLREAMELLALAEFSEEDSLPDVLFDALHRSTNDSQIVIVGAGELDMNDTERFQKIWDDPSKRATLRKIVCLDVTSSEFNRCFQADSTESVPRRAEGELANSV